MILISKTLVTTQRYINCSGAGKSIQLNILEKDVIDEIIFRTQNPRNPLLLELMARGCMRIGEVLNLTPMNIEDRKAIIQDPKAAQRPRRLSCHRKW